jgi:hypothetical protein
MNMRNVHLVVLLLTIAFASCKKEAAQTVNNPNNNNPGGNPQGNYSGTKLTVSTGEKVVSPWIELSSDTVYTSDNAVSSLFKTFPAAFEDKAVSFFLPKGYMVVFAANSDGTGESVSLVAKDNDIKANLPARLRNSISFIRYIKISNPDKKGTCSVNDAAVQAFATQWYYGWSINKSSFPDQQFIPMTWGKGACTAANVKYLVERNDVDHLLSFNEPDNSSQSNIPVIDTAIQRYKIMQKTGLRLGAPVTEQDNTFGTGKWLSNFMAQAQSQKLRIDVLPIHWYDWGSQTNNGATDSLTAEKVFTRFVSFVEKVHQTYPSLPIWVTEYNANPNRSSDVVHRYFMKLSTEWMNSTSYIERYSYFFPPAVPAVQPDNSLTVAGAYWKSLPSSKSLSGNIVADVVLVQ